MTILRRDTPVIPATPLPDTTSPARRLCSGGSPGPRSRPGGAGLPWRPGFGAALLGLLLAAGACGDAASRDEAGAGLEGPDRTLALQAEPLYEVGGFDAPDWATFGDVGRVAFDADGYLYLLDTQVDQVTLVSPEGEFVRTIGSSGEGPGEIRGAFSMTVMPDGRVVISDLGHQALVVYDREGNWLGNVPLDVGEEGLPGGDAAATAGGRIVAGEAIRMRMRTGDEDEDAESLTEEEGRPLWSYPTVEGDTARLLAMTWEAPEPQGEGARMEGGSDGNRVAFQMSRLLAFEPDLLVATLPGGGVAVSDSTTWEVDILDEAGNRIAQLARPIPPVPVTDAVRDAERERRLAEIEERSGSGRLNVMGGGNFQLDPSAVTSMMRDRIETMAFHTEIPVIEALAADGYGRLWVQRSGGVPGEDGPTDVVTADGGYVGTIPPDGLRIPEAFGPDGLAAYIETDDLDVPTVRVVRITGGS